MLIAEDLLLLITDDSTGRLSVPAMRVDPGLGGATLVELTLMNKVDLTRVGEDGRPGRIVVRDSAPTGDAVLDAALRILVDHQGKKPAAVINPLSKKLRSRLYERLTAAGVLQAGRSRALGVLPVHTWPAVDPSHEAEIRRSIIAALVHGATPDARTGALIALLHALGCESDVVDPHEYDVSRHDLRARAREIASGDWSAQAVRTAINEMMAAIIAAVTAASVASGVGD